MSTLAIHEIFSSLQGESKSTGFPTTFVRFFGCNLKCYYCDQPQKLEETTQMTLEEVLNKVAELENRYVCITGGEPLIHQECYKLVAELVNRGYIVNVETNGSRPIDTFRANIAFYASYTFKYPDHKGVAFSYSDNLSFTMDLKTDDIDEGAEKIINLKYLTKNDEVKFIVGSKEDYEYYKHMVNFYMNQSLKDTKGSPTEPPTFIFSPMFKDSFQGEVPVYDFTEEFIKDKPYNSRLGVQIHKILKFK